METGTTTNSQTNIPLSPLRDLAQQFVCPYCGMVNDAEGGQCPSCTMENSAAGRKATKSRIGPWYVLQKRNPAAPGMKFETLLSFVHRGRVKAHSIVRGPTTHQLWRFAAQVRGVSREFGVCYSCGGPLANDAATCPKCNRPQAPPAQPDVFLESAEVEPSTVEAESAAGAVEESHNGASTDGEHDIIIPSLQEDSPPVPSRPPGPLERLSHLRRDRAALTQRISLPDDETRLDDQAGESQPPGPVGPTFVAPARPMSVQPRKRMWIEAAVFVLVLVVAGISALFYVDPRLQAQADKVLRAIGISSGPSAAAVPPATFPQSSPPPEPIHIPTVTPSVPVAPPTPDVHTAPPLAAAASSPPASNAVVPPPSAPPVTHDEPPPVVPDAPAPQPAPSDATAPDTSEAALCAKSLALRNRGIDEVVKGNLAAGIALFEQVEQLPRETWPGDIELRLKAAKMQLAAQSHH